MKQKPSVLLISVDALKPEYVFEQERLNIKLPVITKYFVDFHDYHGCRRIP